MKRRTIIAIAVAIMAGAMPLSAQIRGFMQKPLTEWEFSKDGSSWSRVTVPHSYNAEDGHSPSYYRGEAVYRCSFRVSDTGKNYFLIFEGAAQAAVVEVNGIQVAAHKGGYTTFTVDINDAVKKGDNEVKVVCDNAMDLAMPPITSDFNKNGGLHNPVWLAEMGDIYLSPAEYGMYRLHCDTPEVSDHKVVTNVYSKITNAGNRDAELLVRVELIDADGGLAYKADRKIPVKAFSSYDFDHEILLGGVHLWKGLEDPYLYTVRLEVFNGKRLSDIAETKVGYRSIALAEDGTFLLNGKPYPLRGVSIHQDTDGKASAMTLSDYRRDYEIVKELGANFVRLAHYPHNDMAFRLCDSLGLIVQTEIPWVNICGEDASQAYFNNIRQQMKEMVTNLYNHPSIAFWGMWNELYAWNDDELPQGRFDAERVVYETEKLYDYTKKLDPYRFVGFADCSRLAQEGYPDLKGDYCAQNLYYGWYWDYNEFGGFQPALESVRAKWGNRPVAVTEYGAGSNPFCPVWNPSDAVRTKDDSKHFEEYANKFHEAHAAQIKRMPWLTFTSIWILFDFPVANRMEGFLDSSDGEEFTENDDRKYMNDKGLVTRDRKTKKDAFYLYKALWNKDETTVHITGTRLESCPASESIAIKVYSNAKYLSLYHNDRIVGMLYASGEETGVVWTFPSVTVKSGENVFKVVANGGVKAEYKLIGK